MAAPSACSSKPGGSENIIKPAINNSGSVRAEPFVQGDKHFAKDLAELKLEQRVVIELKNPYLPPWVPLQRKELWFDPKSLK